MYVGHLPARPTSYLGHVFVEPLEHRPGLADLTPAQGAALGHAMQLTSTALRAAGHDHAYAFVLGDREFHLHVNLIGRYPHAPEEYRGTRVDEWPDAPQGDADRVAAYVERLRRLWPGSR